MIFYDLKLEAQRKSIGNCLSRETELSRISRTLQRQYNNNVAIVGPSGIGKTALLQGFAYRASHGKIPGLENHQLAMLPSHELRKFASASGSTGSGERTAADSVPYLNRAFRAISPKTIVFIDDFQNAIDHSRASDLNLLFASFLERSDISLVIAIAEQDFRDLQQSNPGFLQNFELITLKENDSLETKTILHGLSPIFERQYGLKINSAVIAEIADLSAKINSGKKMPLAAIDLLDEVFAFAKMAGKSEVDSFDAKNVFAEKTGIPTATLNERDRELLKNLEADLNKEVIGQQQAVAKISEIVRRSRLALRNPNRPYGSFLFLGPSGVGKTELSKVLAKKVYGTERAFTRIDMSEFGEQHTVQRLIGAPPGYVGYENGGQLTNAIKEQPYSLILLDEIEKANPKIFDIFLQVFEDGRLTDGQGQTVSFSNSIIIATSNLGINEIVAATQGNGAKLQDEKEREKFMQTTMMPILSKHFRLEFINRFDGIIIFNALSQDDLYEIALLEIRKIEQRVAQHDIKFNIDPQILKQKIASLADARLGARPIKRFVEQACENLIASKLL